MEELYISHPCRGKTHLAIGRSLKACTLNETLYSRMRPRFQRN